MAVEGLLWCEKMDLLPRWMEEICRDYKITGDENLQNYWIYRQYNVMKPIGSLVNSNKTDANHPRFAVHFDDGITIMLHTVGGELVYENMLSVGMGTYFLKTGKWPKGKQLEKRVSLSIEFIEKNIKNNRYKYKRNESKK